MRAETGSGGRGQGSDVKCPEAGVTSPAGWPAALLVLAAIVTGCRGPDRTPPSVVILAPAEGDTVRGIVTVRARAKDNDRVAAAELLVDGRLVAGDSTTTGEIYSFSLNTAALVLDTFHTISCAAFDAAGNSDTSDLVRVFVWPGTRHSGTVWADETWTPDGNPHIVSGVLVVRGRLTLAPGVEAQFERGGGMAFVGATGRLKAEGGATGSGEILFTGRAQSPGPGFWRGLSFLSDADASLLRFCVLEYGTVMVNVAVGAATVEDCLIRHGSSHGAVFAGETGGASNTECRTSNSETRTSAFGLRTARESRTRNPTAGRQGAGEETRSGFRRNAVEGCAGFGILVGLNEMGAVGPGNRYEGNAYDGIGILPGTIGGSVRWERQGFPYYITGTVDVGGPDEPALTLAAGCSLLFAEGAALRVGLTGPAGLIADGTEAAIHLGAAGQGRWSGVEFWSQVVPSFSVMRRCVIDRAGGNGIAAVIAYAPVTLTGTTVRRSGSGGVKAVGAGFADFSDNTITGCEGYPLQVGAEAVGSLGGGNRMTGNRADSVAVGSGSVARNATWRNHGIPYRVSGPVRVGSSAMPALTIEPGVRLAFSPGSALILGQEYPGDIIARGVPDSIVFTGLVPEPGAWPGIRCLEGTGGRTEFERCRMLYGGEDGKGILYIERCAPLVMRCEIGWSAACCIGLRESWLDPEQLRRDNWLHDWDPDHGDICEDEFRKK